MLDRILLVALGALIGIPLHTVAGETGGRFAHAVKAQPPAVVSQGLGTPAAPDSRTIRYRFNLDAGSLEAVVPGFEAATSSRVTLPPAFRGLTSPGVVGDLTAEQALERLLAGTGLTFASTSPRDYAISARVGPLRVDVTGYADRYRVQESATATKTPTALRDIPQTINVLPRDLLVDQDARSIADAVKNVPGVSVAQGEGNRDQVVLRGINTASDFFVNGIRDDQERFRDLYNVQRIEVVQGPAAVLFGRGGAGGVVNLVTAEPMRGTPSEASVTLGSYNSKRSTARVNVPIGSAAVFQMSAMGEDSGGFRDGFFLKRYGVNPTVRLDLGRGTRVSVGFEHLDDHRLADRGIPSRGGRPVDVRSNQFFGSRDQNRAQSGVDAASATFEHRFNRALSLRNSLLVGRYEKYYQNVYPGSAVSVAETLSLSAYNHQVDRTNTFNQTDLLYRADWGRMTHTLLFGVEAGHQFQDELRHTAAGIPNVPLSSSVRDASFSAAPLVIDRHATADVIAGYVQDQIAVARHWKAVVGARTDRFRVSVDDRLPANTDLSRVDVQTSPRAGLIYQPVESAALYASSSYTFLPSGQTLGLATNTAQLEPETATNNEVGAKIDLLARRLSVAAALFRLDRNHVRTTDPNDPTRLVLTGQQRTEGFSASVAGSVASRWKLYAGYANLDARITQNTASAPAGRTVGLVPRHQVNLWSTYDVSPQWGGGGGVIHQSRMYTAFSNLVELPGFTRVDSVVYYRMRRYRIALNLDNLFNARYYPTANGDNNISPGAPRNIRLGLSASF
jgi:catecholate siderophore receptor